MKRSGTWFMMIAVLVSILGGPQSLNAEQGIEPEFLAEIQGRWVSRFPFQDTEIEIAGREVRAVVAKPGSEDQVTPGTVVAQITGVVKRTEVKSLVDGQTIYNYEFSAQNWTTDGSRWYVSSESLKFNYLNYYTNFCRDSSSSQSKPINNYRMLSGLWGGDVIRPDQKRKTFPPRGSVPNWADPIVPKCTQSQPARTTSGPSTMTVSGTAQTIPPVSAPETSDQTPSELAEADRLNRDQAAFGARQNAEYEAAKLAYEKAVRDREATIVRQKAEHEAAVEAERLRREREHEAVMARWRADVEACKKGDRTKCAK